MGERMLSFLVILGVAVAGYLGLPLVVILIGALALTANNLKREQDLYRKARAMSLDEVVVVGVAMNALANLIACGAAFLLGFSLRRIGELIEGFTRDQGSGAVALWLLPLGIGIGAALLINRLFDRTIDPGMDGLTVRMLEWLRERRLRRGRWR